MFLAIQKRAALTNVKKGFTLIELIIVIVILVVLAAIAVPSIMSYVKQASDARTISNARSTYSAACLEIANAIINTGATPATFDATAIANALANAGAPSGATFTGTIQPTGAVTGFTYTENAIKVERNDTTNAFAITTGP